MRRRRYDIRNDPAFVAFVGEKRRHQLMKLAKRHPEAVSKIWKAYHHGFLGDRQAWRSADRRLAALWEKHLQENGG